MLSLKRFAKLKDILRNKMITQNDTKVELNALYQEIILEHHKDPRNFGPLSGAEAKAEGFNPVCGDRVEVEVKRSSSDPSKLSEVRYSGEGCSICMSSASMMTEDIEGESFKNIEERIQDFRDVMQGKSPEAFKESDLESLTGVCKFPVRIKCALLPWTTLKEAIRKLES